MKKHKLPEFMCFLLIPLFLVLPGNNAVEEFNQQNISLCNSLDTETKVYQFDNAENDYVEKARSPVWSPDGKKIALWVQRTDTTKIISDSENWLHIVDVTNGNKVAELAFDQYTNPTDIAWSNDSTKLAVTYSNYVGVWEGGSDWNAHALKIKSSSRFEQAIWSTDNTQLITANTAPPSDVTMLDGILEFANVVRRWDTATGDLLEESPIFEQVFLTKFGNQTLVIARDDELLSVRDAETNQVLWSLPDAYLAGSVFNGQVQRLATITSLDNSKERIATFSIWDIPSNQNLLEVSGNYYPYVNFAPDGNLFQSSLRGRGSVIWDIDRGTQIILPTLADYTWVGAYWASGGDCAISIGSTELDLDLNRLTMQAILLWNVSDPQNARTLLESEIGYNGLAWSPDGQRLAVIYRTPLSAEQDIATSPSPRFSTALYIWTASGDH